MEHPPKGEILIEEGWLAYNGFNSLAEAVETLQTDLVVLPAWPGKDNKINWDRWLRSGIFLFSCLQGPVTHFTMRAGWHAFSRLLLKKPLEAANVMADYMKEAVQHAANTLDKGCEGVVVFDDLAGDQGPLISPKFLGEVYFPIMEKALRQLNSKTVPVIFHSDGYIAGLLSALKNAGFWGIQGLQPGLGIGPELFRSQDLQNWIFWGNFEFEGKNRLKDKAEINKDVRQLLNDWSDFPGYIFGSSGGLYKGLPLEDVQFAYQQAGNWRK